MLKKIKKKMTGTAMKLMMNEKVARTVMTAFQKKNQLNEKLAGLYGRIELPSLSDHESVKYGVDKIKRRIKGLENEISQAEFAMEKVESVIDRADIILQEKPGKRNKTAASELTNISLDKPKTRKSTKPVKKTKVKQEKKTIKAKKKKAKSKIAPLGATNSESTIGEGLLDLNFNKKGKKRKSKSA